MRLIRYVYLSMLVVEQVFESAWHKVLGRGQKAAVSLACRGVDTRGTLPPVYV